MGRSKENKKIANKKVEKLHKLNSKSGRVFYDKLEFGKSSFDLVIDDKFLFFKKNCHYQI